MFAYICRIIINGRDGRVVRSREPEARKRAEATGLSSEPEAPPELRPKPRIPVGKGLCYGKDLWRDGRVVRHGSAKSKTDIAGFCKSL